MQVLACVRDSKPSTKDKAERFRLAELAETTKTDDSSDSYSSDNEDDLRDDTHDRMIAASSKTRGIRRVNSRTSRDFPGVGSKIER